MDKKLKVKRCRVCNKILVGRKIFGKCSACKFKLSKNEILTLQTVATGMYFVAQTAKLWKSVDGTKKKP